jgi:hypothetical protein
MSQAMSAPSADSSVSLQRTEDNSIQALMNMLATQHALTTATLTHMSAQHEALALQTAQHTETMVTRATQQAISREIQNELDHINREKVQITGVLASAGIPEFYRGEKVAALAALQVRGQALTFRKLAHEQQYHLLTAADEGVVARPSQC